MPIRSLVISALVLLVSVVAPAQSKPGVIAINGGRNAIFVGKPDRSSPAAHPAAGLVTIYSNLGTGSNVYNGIAGTGILGRAVPGMLYPEWLADSFVPTADHMVTQIQVGVTWVQGPNGVILSLTADNPTGGPGQPLKSWRLPNLPVFGTCCTLQTVSLTTPIPVTAGTKYWIVLRTPDHNQTTWAVWNDNFNELNGQLWNNLGFGWIDEGMQAQGAFGVFGL
jgi:hypothetical protein